MPCYLVRAIVGSRTPEIRDFLAEGDRPATAEAAMRDWLEGHREITRIGGEKINSSSVARDTIRAEPSAENYDNLGPGRRASYMIDGSAFVQEAKVKGVEVTCECGTRIRTEMDLNRSQVGKGWEPAGFFCPRCSRYHQTVAWVFELELYSDGGWTRSPDTAWSPRRRSKK